MSNDVFMNQSPPGSLKRSSSRAPMDQPSPKRTTLETTLKSVPNDLDDMIHTRLDQEVLGSFKVTDVEPPNIDILSAVVENSEGRLDPRYLKHRELRELVGEYPELEDKLSMAWRAGSFKEIRNLRIIRPIAPSSSSTSSGSRLRYQDPMIQVQNHATEYSWTCEYVGNASEELWDNIKTAFRDSDSAVYAYYLTIVQSSGMGKSRTADELGKKHILIPMNLRESHSSGYPPADHDVRNFLCEGNSKSTVVYTRICAFLAALFHETAKVLGSYSDSVAKPEELPLINLDADVAGQFRAYMAAGMTMTEHGRFRRDFYARVTDYARRVTKSLCETYLESASKPKIPRSPNPEFPPIKEFTQLQRVVCRNKDQASENPTHNTSTRSATKAVDKTILEDGPLIILEFDAVHTMMEQTLGPSAEWTNFSELEHVLQTLKKLSLFSLFLSTAGNVHQFVPSPKKEYSRHTMRRPLRHFQPFTDLGFDQLAKKITLDGRLTVDDITSDDFVAHFGRPMFGARFDYRSSEIKSGIVEFAAMKLLGGELYTNKLSLTDHQKLACLSQRLPIEFNSTTYADHSEEMEQVEGHLRVCLRVDAGFESMTTVSSSEPLLSEAAYWVMSNPAFDSAEALKLILENFAVHKGDRGELLVMMLLTQARDSAVGPPCQLGKPKQRWMSVNTFFENLFYQPKPTEATSSHRNIFLAEGQVVSSQGSSSAGITFKTQFADSKFYFNHWIKVHQWGVLDIRRLLALYCRGAAVLCANSQSGIDGLMPFLLKGTEVALNNVGVCLWQTRNDPSVTDEVDQHLFERMDPFSLKIFNDNAQSDIKIIRIVFALAANEPSLQVVKIRNAKNGAGGSYTTYDIWCSGLSPDILVPVHGKYEAWKALLQASYGWREIYDGRNVQQGRRRSMNPGAALDWEHWSRWTESNVFS